MIHIDLDTAAHRTLMSPEQLPQLPALGADALSDIGFEYLAFSPGGDAFIYKMGNSIYWLDTQDGTLRVMATISESLYGVTPDSLSPNRRRLLYDYWNISPEYSDDGSERLYTVNVHDFGESTNIYASPEWAEFSWLDDDHLVKIEDRKRLFVVAVDGTSSRQVFPVIDKP